jgi:phosphoribosylformylglycinamidine cyclo-ligase
MVDEDPTTQLTYAASGVDIAAGDDAVERLKSAVASTNRPGVIGGIGGFAAAFDLDVAGYDHPVLVSSTDGVGTKLDVARAARRYDTIGIDLVAMCVDDIACLGAEPLFFLDYISVAHVVPEQIEEIVTGIASGCRLAGCALVGGETAEHPGAEGALDLAGFAVGVVERGRELGRSRVAAGDVLIGLGSPGLRSNGYTLARHVLLDRAGIALSDPAWKDAPHSLADELLRPSIVYSSLLTELNAAVRDGLHAAAHITGGGIAGNLSRILPDHLDAHLDRSAWLTPRIFHEIARLGPVDDAEMARVFNLGLGMILVVHRDRVDDALASLNDHLGSVPGEPEISVVGEVTAGSGGVVIL